MSRRFQEFQLYHPDIQFVSVLYLQCRKLCRRSLAIDDLRTGPTCQFKMAADKIGVRMCLNDIFDLLAVRFGFVDILLNVALRIDDRCLIARTEIIGSMCKTSQIEL